MLQAEHLKYSDKPHLAHSMSWAQRLKRVFSIDITQCETCEKLNANIIACITKASVIQKIMSHLDNHNLLEASNDSHTQPLRAPLNIEAFTDYTIQRDFYFGA